MTDKWKLAIKIMISIALVIYAISRADLLAAARLLPDARWLPLIAMLALNFLSRLLSAYRWYRLVKPVQPELRYLPFVKITLSSSFYGQFLPGGGVETLQILGLASKHSKISTATASVFADRALGLITTSLFLIVGLSLTHQLDGPNLLPLAVLACAALSLVLLLLVNRDVRTLLFRILPRRVRSGLIPWLDAKLMYFDTFRERPRFLLDSALLAALMQILRIFLFYFGAVSLVDSVPLMVLFLAVPTILFLLVLPISVGGIGVRESTLVFFFAMYGLDESVALALAILVYAGNIIVASPGAWFGLQLFRQRAPRMRE